MEDKFNTYYNLLNVYNLNRKKGISSKEELDPIEISFFKDFCPIKISVLMRDVEFVINNLCKKLLEKEKVLKEIESLKNNHDLNSSEYKWKDIDIIDLLKGDYQYLIDKFIIRIDLVPNIESFVNYYCFPKQTYVYPFSLKELYYKLLYRSINITINNYFL